MSEERLSSTLTLIQGLKDSLEQEEQTGKQAGNVVDFRKAKVDSGTLLAREVTPAEVLTQALEDLGSLNVAKCYITLVIDNGETWATTNYRANLTRAEEIAFRQLGITEMLESWRNG